MLHLGWTDCGEWIDNLDLLLLILMKPRDRRDFNRSYVIFGSPQNLLIEQSSISLDFDTREWSDMQGGMC